MSTTLLPVSKQFVPYTGFPRVRPMVTKSQLTILVALILIIAALLPSILAPETLKKEEELLWKEANFTFNEIEAEIEEGIEVDPAVAAAALRSTATLISSIVLGVLCAKYGVLDSQAIEALARLAYNIFEPCLMLCSVSKTLSVEVGGLSKQSLFVLMPLASLIHTFIGYFSGKIAIHTIPMRSPSDARDVHFCASFSNSVNLPMVFAASLFPVHGRMAADTIACISFYVLLICPIFYTMGVGFLQTEDEKRVDPDHLARKKENAIIAGIKQTINPPVIGACLGVALGTIPFLKRIFLSQNGFGVPVFGAMQTFGQAYLPSSILVLAGSMSAATGDSSSERQRSFGRGDSDTYDDAGKPIEGLAVEPSLSSTSMITISVIKFIVWPIGTALMCEMLSKTSLLGDEKPRNRAILTFVMLIQGCMPPAQNSVLLLQLAGMKERAYRMTRMLAVLYCFSIIPVTILVSHALERTKIMQFVDKK